ncbi:MAG: O-methyltransferase, partial [Candidatus Zixiibacteriota bacterium]
LYPGRVFREYMSLVGNEKWVCKNVFDIFPEIEQCRIAIEHVPDRSIVGRVEELAYLAIITKTMSPKSIFEIGKYRGRTALNFALNSPAECQINTLDLPLTEADDAGSTKNFADSELFRKRNLGLNFLGKDVSHKITQLFGNSLEFDFTPFHNKVDLVFIDGAHHYQAAKSDTENALKMIKTGGVIMWHDFANYGDYNDVTRAILDCLPGNKVYQIENTELAVYRHE